MELLQYMPHWQLHWESEKKLSNTKPDKVKKQIKMSCLTNNSSTASGTVAIDNKSTLHLQDGQIEPKSDCKVIDKAHTANNVKFKSVADVTESSQTVDQLVVQAFQQGNTKVFDLLVKKYQYRIIALANRFLHDQDEALDVAQETFLKAFRGLAKFRGDSSFYTWLVRIAVNTSKNYLQARSRRLTNDGVSIEDPDASPCVSEALMDIACPEKKLNEMELRSAFNRSLSRLPIEIRTALLLREYDGLSYEEIAEIMECPIGTIRSRIFRGREFIISELNL